MKKDWTNYEDLALATYAVEKFKENKEAEDAIRAYASKSGRKVSDVQKRWNEVVRIKYQIMIQKAIRKEIEVPQDLVIENNPLTIDSVIDFLKIYKQYLQESDLTKLQQQVAQLQVENQQTQDKYDKLSAKHENLIDEYDKLINKYGELRSNLESLKDLLN